MRLTVVFLSLLLLTSCATTAKYNAKLDTWVGKDIYSLIDSWGYPDSTVELPNGNKVYTYSKAESLYVPPMMTTTTTVDYGVAYSRTTGYGGGHINNWCKTSFETEGSTGNILKWTHKGNHCKSR